MRYYLGLKPDVPQDLAPHRALYDTLVTLAIVEHMLKDHPMQELLELQKQPILLKTVSFGKNKGMLWSQVDAGYLRWMLNQDPSGGIGDDQRYTARYWLQHG
jgi:exodeoxyribonuclease X